MYAQNRLGSDYRLGCILRERTVSSASRVAPEWRGVYSLNQPRFSVSSLESVARGLSYQDLQSEPLTLSLHSLVSQSQK